MAKTLVAYFSASGVTKAVAETIAEVSGSDIYEIKPETPYTEADLDWRDKTSRSSVEMQNPDSRPAIANKADNIEQYDRIFIGFPIWWYVAPTIINTFLESYDFAGKTIILFATSGGSGFGKTAEKLKEIVSADTKIIEGKLFNGSLSDQDIKEWVDNIG